MFFRIRNFSSAIVVALLGFALNSCSRSTPQGPLRVAIIAFDNLSPEAELSWAGEAIATIAAAQVPPGEDDTAVFEIGSVRDAHLRQATRTVSGYLTSPGKDLILHGSVRDEQRRRIADEWTESGDILALADSVARRTGRSVQPYTTASKEAVKAYFVAAKATDPADIRAGLQEARKLDPAWGAPLVALAQVHLRAGQTEEAKAAAAAARQARLTHTDKIRLDLIDAEMAGDGTARLEAMFRLARLQASDSRTWSGFVEVAMNAREYQRALEAADQALALDPANESALNARGYAHVYLGDLPAARSAFEQYQTQLPQSANAVDSLAEALFYHGEYKEAAPLFLQAHQLNPAHVSGHEPVRAALATFLAGDTAAADKLIDEWLKEREARGDKLLGIRRDIWMNWTGRQPQSTSEGSADLAMRALWALQKGDRTSAAGLAGAARAKAASAPETNLASIALLLAQPSASPQEWESRLQKAIAHPAQADARDRLLGWALMLDRHPREAAEVWRRVVDRTPGLIDNSERVLLAAALQKSGQQEAARKVLPYGFLPPQSLEPGLNALIIPEAMELVKHSRSLRSSA